MCFIACIRHQYGFAQELRGVTPEFKRALNARDTMSGASYSIWYLDVPKEVTPRTLIYEQNLYQSVKFEIMNDYTRTFGIASRRVVPMNGDTAVHSSLNAKSKHEINIRRAINARHIMSYDLNWLTADTPEKVLPDLTRYLNVAHSTTYEGLACLRRIKHFQNDILVAVPDAAEKFKSPHHNSDWWGIYYIANDPYFLGRFPVVRLNDPVQRGARDEGLYDGMYCGIGGVDIALFRGSAISRETWKREMEDR
ncbi:uncharacterized protein BDW70DRAFT_170380 [Aspergillus foveolatus]|uniref:uncharacterized protein n=1 Tax=Aspergillus foveolatus TaxID=210207 RepID=UPI003CCCBF58